MPKTLSSAAASKRNTRHISAENRNTFPFVLYNLVDSGLYDCLRWNNRDDGVIITSKDSIVDIVLPNHFNTREFASFTRQFHIYGFRRVTDNRKAKHSAGYCEFTHPWFRRGRQELLQKIVRSASKKYPAPTPSPILENESLSRRIGVLAINETASARDCVSATAPENAISPRVMPAISPVAGTALQDRVKIEDFPQLPAIRDGGRIPAEDQTAGCSQAVDISKLVESPNSKNACCALQTLTDIHENLDPEVLEFVRQKLGYLMKSIDDILQRNAVPSMPLSCENASPIRAPASAVVHNPLDVHPPHTAPFAASSSLLTRTLSAGNAVPALSFPTTTVPNSSIPHMPLQQPMVPQAPMLTGNMLGGANAYSVATASISTHGTPSPMCSSMESSPYVPMTAAPAPMTAGPIASGFPLLYPPAVAPEHIQSQSFEMNCLEMYNSVSFGGVATAPPTAGSRFSEHMS